MGEHTGLAPNSTAGTGGQAPYTPGKLSIGIRAKDLHHAGDIRGLQVDEFEVQL